MPLRMIAAVLIGIWLILVLLGKSGFVHVLILTGLGVGLVAGLRMVRERTPAD